jgi:hypothetical protein
MHRTGRSDAGHDEVDDARAATPGRTTRTGALSVARVQRVAGAGDRILVAVH